MRKTLACIITLLLLSSILSPFTLAAPVPTLNVYNWGEYVSDGSEGTLDVNAAFEDWYFKTTGQKVRVNYTTYASNEDMYNKLSSGAAIYDVVVPSDYMIQRMIAEEMLRPLNFDNIPNFKYISPDFKNLFYDPEGAYTVPYTYGMVGIIYNQTMVDAADTHSWNCMWDKDYAGKILQFNNSRDALGTAMYRLGIDVNTTDRDQMRSAMLSLIEQKPLIQSYVMDEIFNKMKTGSAAIAPYYAGDFLAMYEDNPELAFSYPKEGTNVFVDAFCVPKNARQPALAEAYINFMLSKEPAIANAEYLYYACPNTLVTEDAGYRETMAEVHPDAMEILYPETTDFTVSYYQNLDPETLKYTGVLWEELKMENSIEPWILWSAGSILALIIGLLLFKTVRSAHRRRQY